MLSDGAAFTTHSLRSLRSYANSCHYRERFVPFHKTCQWTMALCGKCCSIWKNVRDLLLITEPDLLTKCTWKSHSINRAALVPRERFESMRSRLLCSSHGALMSYNDRSACQCHCIRRCHICFKPARESKTIMEAEDQTSSRILSVPSSFESQVWQQFGFYTLLGKHD